METTQMPADTCMRWALALSLMCSATVAQAATVWVGRFPAGAAGLPEPWRVQQLDERIVPTVYARKTWDGVDAIEAVAERSMALLGRPLEVETAKEAFTGLLIVDGIRADQSSLKEIPSDRIQSVTVFKGAQAVALYGPDGAKGVIVIKTKPRE